MTWRYLVVDDKRAAAAEPADGGHGILHVGADEVNVVNLEASDQGIRESGKSVYAFQLYLPKVIFKWGVKCLQSTLEQVLYN